MANMMDVAKYVLQRGGEMTAMKLQKLMYYSQAWSLVWEEEPLFEDDFEAWANGPVLRRLYDCHRGQFKLTADSIAGNADALSDLERENVGRVIEFYGNKSAQWLSNLTHKEAPWIDARAGLEDGVPCTNIIGKDSLLEYYGAL